MSEPPASNLKYVVVQRQGDVLDITGPLYLGLTFDATNPVEKKLANLVCDALNTVCEFEHSKFSAAHKLATDEINANWSAVFNAEIENMKEGPRSQGLVPYSWETFDSVFGDEIPVVHFGYAAPPGHILDDKGAVKKDCPVTSGTFTPNRPRGQGD